MKKSTNKMKLKVVLITFLFVNCMTGFASNPSLISLADSASMKVSVSPTGMQDIVMSNLIEALPEVFESIGLSERKVNASLKRMSKSLGSKIRTLKKYAKKDDFSSDEEKVKKMLSDMGLRIGGTKYETFALSSDYVSAFTPENIDELKVALTKMKDQYDEVLKVSGMQPKLEFVANFKQNLKQLKDIKLMTATSKEYGQWMTKMMSSNIKAKANLNPTKAKKKDVAPKNNTPSAHKIKQDSIKKANNKRNAEIFKTAYVLKPEQVIVSSMPYKNSNDTKLISIERAKNETRVTVAVPIHFTGNWINTDSAFHMIDLQTKDRYFPRRLENDIPLNRVIIVNGFARTMIELTYIYPPLKKSVVMVDLVESNESNVELPSNSSAAVEIRNVFVDTRKETKEDIR